MEGLESDSTHELLNRYRTKEGNNENITIYSDEDSIFNSPSIEIGRSVARSTNIPSPFKKSAMDRNPSLSPSKKIRNDYQDHLHKMRGSSSSGSPLKRHTYDLSEYNDFDDIKGMSGLNMDSVNVSDSTMDKEIQRILDMSSLKLPEVRDDDHERDRTKLLIKETHKLINTLPSSITSSKEGEACQKILTTSINKLVKQVESMKRELDMKDDEVKTSRIQVSNIEMKMGLCQRENSELKKEISQLKRRSAVLPKDSRKNELLRTKLIKYRNLYTEADAENQDLKSRLGGQSAREPARQQTPLGKDRSGSQATPADRRSPAVAMPVLPLPQEGYKQRLMELQNQLSDIINEVTDNQPELQHQAQSQRTPEPDRATDPHSQPSLRMLAIFEDLVQAMKSESAENQNIQEEAAGVESEPIETRPVETGSAETKPVDDGPRHLADPVLAKILDSIDKNNQMYNTLLGALTPDSKAPHPHVPAPLAAPLAAPVAAPVVEETREGDHRDREKDIVFQCYVCCPQNHRMHAKRPCKRCSAASSEASGSAGNSAGNPASSSSTADAHQHVISVPSHMADLTDPKDNKTINLMGEYKWTI